MKIVKVVAAVIRKDNLYFASQRGYGDFKDGWEFPGGKMEENETQEQALVREIKEELDCQIEVDEFIGQVEHDYPNFHLSMACYFCHIASGQLTLKEHEASKWVTIEEFDEINWLPADQKVIEMIKNKRGETK